MSPEEFKFLKQISEENKKLSEENSIIQKGILELKMMFVRLAAEKEQRRRDELTRRRERGY